MYEDQLLLHKSILCYGEGSSHNKSNQVPVSEMPAQEQQLNMQIVAGEYETANLIKLLSFYT